MNLTVFVTSLSWTKYNICSDAARANFDESNAENLDNIKKSDKFLGESLNKNDYISHPSHNNTSLTDDSIPYVQSMGISGQSPLLPIGLLPALPSEISPVLARNAGIFESISKFF